MPNKYVDRSDPMPINKVLAKRPENLRLLNFYYNGTVCVSCGIEGKYFRLERSPSNTSSKRHYNLYAVSRKGKEVLMTRDHILPTVLGGPNTIQNMRTMCEHCNSKRGSPLEFPEISACPM